MSEELKKGLEGVVVAESSLSYIDGDAGRLIYRGYDIEDLAEGATFEEVVYLLWHGELPTESELSEFNESLVAARSVDDAVLDTVRALAEADEEPMAALRTLTSYLSAEDDADPEGGDLEAARRIGRKVTAKMPTVLAAFDRVRRGEEPLEPRDDLSHAANFLYMLTGAEPDPVAEETFDMALTLHADHGLNASTFTAMVIGSTLADLYSSVTGGIGALSGPLHGGANQDVMEMLLEIDDSGEDPVEFVERAREERENWRVPGMGHRVYNVKDPRAKILETKSKELGEASGDTKWYDMADAIEGYFAEKGLVEKGIAPNVDFYSGTVYYQLGIAVDMFTPIFAMSRVGGWIGHTLEYQEDNRLIRPRAHYTGETDREFPALGDR
ncbi:citrate synthase [Halorarius halobius]|uniref:citrate synthase n=1 Tax=Halorarius halobius TaxID=2962671 RepID=UPI0020CE5BDD|nr:citrate synthase [Halorarius halobius]